MYSEKAPQMSVDRSQRGTVPEKGKFSSKYWGSTHFKDYLGVLKYHRGSNTN